MADIQTGQQWRLLRKQGSDVATGLNADASPLAAGIIGTVRELVPAEVPGAHNNEEDAAVLEFPVPAVGYDDAGQPKVTYLSRAVSFALTDFDDPEMFELVDAPAAPVEGG